MLNHNQLSRLSAIYGWNKDCLTYVDYALKHGTVPISSMGSKISMPALAPYERMLADYFRQVFPQLIRPPFDRITDKLDMSVAVNDKIYNSPLLQTEQKIDLTGIKQISVFNERNLNYENWVENIRQEVIAASAAPSIILNDEFEAAQLPTFIQMPVAVRIARQALDEAGRHETKIIVSTGQIQTPHHLAVIIGCGASLVYPHLLYEYAQNQGDIKKLYQAYNDGLIHAISRAGLGSVKDYIGAFCFETIGVDGRDETLAKLFGKSSLDIGGLTVRELEHATRNRAEALPEYGLFGNPLAQTQSNRKLISQEFIDRLQAAEKNQSPFVDIDSHKLSDEVRRLYKTEAERLAKTPIAPRHLFQLKSAESTTSNNLKPYLEAYQIAGMAYGAVKAPAHNLLAQVASELGIQMSTGAGPRVVNGIRTAQLAGGRYGVDANFLLNAKVIEIKIAQGASPGDVAQFLATRINVDMAVSRNCLPNNILPNPLAHYDVQNIDDIAMKVNELRNLFAGAGKQVKIAVKLVASDGIGSLAVELAKRGVDIINVTGDSGGSMSSPLMSAAGMPTELGVRDVHIKLSEAGLRHNTKIIQSGDANTPNDIAFAYLNGADTVESGKGALIHLAGCEMHAACFDCTKGITSNPEKFDRDVNVAKTNLLNLLAATAEILAELGFNSPQAALGKLHEVAALRPIEELQSAGVALAANLNPTLFLNAPKLGVQREKQIIATPTLENSYGSKLAGETFKYLSASKYNSLTKTPQNSSGERGDGYAAYLNGLTVTNHGAVGRFAGKSMSLGNINVINPGQKAVGDCALYAATGGKANILGNAGKLFMVGNSGSDVVIEGDIGQDAFREMRRGSVIMLGSTGANAFKSCYGGIFVIYDPKNKLTAAPPEGKVYSLQDLTANPLLRNSLQGAVIKRLREFSAVASAAEDSVAQTIIASPEEHLRYLKIVITHGMRLNMDPKNIQDLAEVFKAKPPTGIERAVFDIIAKDTEINIDPSRNRTSDAGPSFAWRK